jgi:hypothetical protein
MPRTVVNDMQFHLAQVNVSVARYAYDDPRFAGFVDNLERIYTLAESTPGFVWRHVTVDGDSEAKNAFAASNLIYNASLWESKEALNEFVYKSDHVGILRQRADWFAPMEGPVFALWWQAAGSIPTILETKGRLDCLHKSGPTEQALTFRSFFEQPPEAGPGND